MIPKVEFEVVSGMYCKFLNYIVENNIYISTLKSTPWGFTAICYAKDYSKIAKTARKYQCRTKIKNRKGVYFKIRKLSAHKGVAVGVIMIFIYVYLFSNIIWRIDVIASDKNITEDVYSILYANNCYVGAFFSQPDNQRIIQQINMEVDNVAYVTSNFYKGILICKVDATINKLPYLENSTDGDIVANMDGVIEELDIYNGFSDIKIGQSVAKGDILVSATYTDRNGTIQQVMPRAFIKAYGVKEYSAEVNFNKKIYVRTGRYTEDVTYKFAGIDFDIKKADLEEFKDYDKERRFEYVNISGFRIPLTKEIVRYYDKTEINITNNEKQAENTAEKIVETLIKSDEKLLGKEKSEYHCFITEEGVKVICKVYGYFDIT